jgi:hypothetical protein
MTAERLRKIFGVQMGVFTHPLRHEPVSYLLCVRLCRAPFPAGDFWRLPQQLR